MLHASDLVFFDNNNKVKLMLITATITMAENAGLASTLSAHRYAKVKNTRTKCYQ